MIITSAMEFSKSSYVGITDRPSDNVYLSTLAKQLPQVNIKIQASQEMRVNKGLAILQESAHHAWVLFSPEGPCLPGAWLLSCFFLFPGLARHPKSARRKTSLRCQGQCKTPPPVSSVQYWWQYRSTLSARQHLPLLFSICRRGQGVLVLRSLNKNGASGLDVIFRGVVNFRLSLVGTLCYVAHVILLLSH